MPKPGRRDASTTESRQTPRLAILRVAHVPGNETSRRLRRGQPRFARDSAANVRNADEVWLKPDVAKRHGVAGSGERRQVDIRYQAEIFEQIRGYYMPSANRLPWFPPAGNCHIRREKRSFFPWLANEQRAAPRIDQHLGQPQVSQASTRRNAFCRASGSVSSMPSLRARHHFSTRATLRSAAIWACTPWRPVPSSPGFQSCGEFVCRGNSCAADSSLRHAAGTRMIAT